MMNPLRRAPRHRYPLMLGLLLTAFQGARADEVNWDGVHDRDLSAWEFQYSPLTYHFSKEPHSSVWLAGLARISEYGWLAGGAVFRNSFGQPCAYGFAGRKYVEPWGRKDVYWSWTAGLIYGYKPPYEDKVPFNTHGVAPAFVPAVGYQVTRQVAVQFTLLGTAGLMLNLVLDLEQVPK